MYLAILLVTLLGWWVHVTRLNGWNRDLQGSWIKRSLIESPVTVTTRIPIFFSRGSQPKPSCVTVILGRGDDPMYSQDAFQNFGGLSNSCSMFDWFLAEQWESWKSGVAYIFMWINSLEKFEFVRHKKKNKPSQTNCAHFFGEKNIPPKIQTNPSYHLLSISPEKWVLLHDPRSQPQTNRA